MPAVGDVTYFNPQVGLHGVLGTQVPILREARGQSVWVYGRNGEKTGIRRAGHRARRELAGIAIVPLEGTGGIVGAPESGSEPVGNTRIILDANGYESKTEGTANDPTLPRGVGKANLRAEVFPILIFFEAISAVSSIDNRSRNAEVRV